MFVNESVRNNLHQEVIASNCLYHMRNAQHFVEKIEEIFNQRICEDS
jgi:hypothetical protein